MLDGIRPNVRVRSRSPAEVSFCALRYRRRSLAMVVPDLPDLHRVIWSRSRSRIVRRGVLDHSLGSCGWPACRVTLCGIAQVRVRLSEAQGTLLVTLCGRAWDARARQPILGDTMAEAAVEQMDYGFWRAKVNPRRRRSPADRPTLIVAEGLTMYLKPEEGHELMRRLTGHFVHRIIAFDAFNRLTIRVQHLNPAARGCGARIVRCLAGPAEGRRQRHR
jgi:hypothetical protein